MGLMVSLQYDLFSHFFQVEERLEAYMDGFDIVLIDDQTMDVVNSVVRLME